MQWVFAQAEALAWPSSRGELNLPQDMSEGTLVREFRGTLPLGFDGPATLDGAGASAWGAATLGMATLGATALGATALGAATLGAIALGTGL